MLLCDLHLNLMIVNATQAYHMLLDIISHEKIAVKPDKVDVHLQHAVRELGWDFFSPHPAADADEKLQGLAWSFVESMQPTYFRRFLLIAVWANQLFDPLLELT